MSEGSASAGKDAFVMRLRKLHDSSLRPTYRSLAKLSLELKQLYPDYRGELRILSVTAISEILNGKRVPTAGWVASFVLSCQHWAWKMAPASEDPGTDSLPEWFTALRATYETSSSASGPGNEDMAPAAGPIYLCPPITVRLTPVQRDLVESYGPYGYRLLGQFEAGEPDAVYRVALLMSISPAHVSAAQSLFLHAAAAYHPAALELLDSNASGLRAQDLARHAFRLAESAQACDSNEEARVFYACAAAAGHATARLKVAIDWLGNHDEPQIVGWLAEIASSLGEH